MATQREVSSLGLASVHSDSYVLGFHVIRSASNLSNCQYRHHSVDFRTDLETFSTLVPVLTNICELSIEMVDL